MHRQYHRPCLKTYKFVVCTMNACSLLIGIVSQAYIAEGGYNICHLTYLYIYPLFFLVSRVLDMIIFFADVMKSLRTPILLGKILRGTSFWNKEEAIMCLLYIYIYIEFWHFTSTIVSHFSISSAFLSIAQGCWDRFVVQIWFVCSSVLGVVGRSAVSLFRSTWNLDCVTPSQQVS